MKLLLGSHRRGEGIPLPLASLIELDSEVDRVMSGSCFPKDILLGVRSQQLLHTFEGTES